MPSFLHRSASPLPARPANVDSPDSAMLVGIFCGGASAVLYTVTNICLRHVSSIDPVLVSTIKALPTLLIVCPLIWLQSRRQPQGPNTDRSAHWIQRLGLGSWPDVLLLAVMSFAVQIFGNVGFQWALSILGLTISIPIVLATMLIGGAISGRVVLGEQVSAKKIWSIAILIVATSVLSYGASGSDQESAPMLPAVLADGKTALSAAGIITFGLLANVASGFAYAFQSTVMRRGMQRGLSVSATLFVVSLSGFSFLAVWTLVSIGPQQAMNTPRPALLVMAAAGIFNALAFFAMTKSLKHVSVLLVQLLNASQVAISAVAGWLLFQEDINVAIGVGLLLTAVGLVVSGWRRRRSPAPTEAG